MSIQHEFGCPADEGLSGVEMRMRLFRELDLLAFALECEASEAIQRGQEWTARDRQAMRLGVRLAHRLVSGVHSDEVQGRMERCRTEWKARMERELETKRGTAVRGESKPVAPLAGRELGGSQVCLLYRPCRRVSRSGTSGK